MAVVRDLERAIGGVDVKAKLLGSNEAKYNEANDEHTQMPHTHHCASSKMLRMSRD